jgi:hypothetical protein
MKEVLTLSYDPVQLSGPTTHPRTKEALPTLRELVAFMLTGHMGQLSSGRRMIGLPPRF